jgi:hypothetical protein
MRKRRRLVIRYVFQPEEIRRMTDEELRKHMDDHVRIVFQLQLC